MDIEKTMEFILTTQARLEASAAAPDERLAELERLAKQHDARIAAVTDLVGRVAQAEIALAERQDSLAESMAVGFKELREIQAATEYKLNALIDTVDKLVGRDGHGE